MKATRLLLFLWTLAVFAAPCLAQDDDEKKKDKDKKEEKDKKEDKDGDFKHGPLYLDFHTYFLIGGEVSGDNFDSRQGYGAAASVLLKFNKHVYYGLGAGYERTAPERFVPVYLTVVGVKKKKDDCVTFRGKFGYAFASSDDFEDYEGYEFRGGFMFQIGTGYRIALNEDKRQYLTFGVDFRHQFAALEYDLEPEFSYDESLNYDFLALSVGLHW